jgi:hypothetical protein
MVVGPLDVTEAALDDPAPLARPPVAAPERPVVFACPTLNVRCRSVPESGGAA